MPVWKSRKALLLIIPFAALAALGAAAYFGRSAGSASASDSQSVKTSVARSGSLSLTASGTGSLVPASEVEVGFKTSGVLSQLLVSVGDQVRVEMSPYDLGKARITYREK